MILILLKFLKVQKHIFDDFIFFRLEEKLNNSMYCVLYQISSLICPEFIHLTSFLIYLLNLLYHISIKNMASASLVRMKIYSLA